MHEMSIAEAIILAVLKEKEERRLSEVATVGVKVGALSGVLPDALQFSFENAVKGTPISGSSLDIECVSAEGRCKECFREFSIDHLWFRCPDCDGDQIEMLSGWELDISYLEVRKEPNEK